MSDTGLDPGEQPPCRLVPCMGAITPSLMSGASTASICSCSSSNRQQMSKNAHPFLSYWQARDAWMMYMLLIPPFPRTAVAGMTDAPDREDLPTWLHERLPVHINIAVGAMCDLAFGCEAVPDGVSETGAAAQACKRRLLRTESLLCTHSVGTSLPSRGLTAARRHSVVASVWCPRQCKAVQCSASAYSSLQSALQYAKHSVTACKNLGWACLDLSQPQSGTYWLSPFLLRMPTMYDSLQC